MSETPWYRRGDPLIGILAFGLAVFGVVMVRSASAATAFARFGDVDFFVSKQITALIIGLIVLAAASFTPLNLLKKAAPVFGAITLILLLSVFILDAPTINGARRWIFIGGTSFQPAELVKFTFIVFMASWFAERRDRINDMRETVLPFLVLIGIVSVLMLMQPDFGTLTIIVTPILVMYFVAGMSLRTGLLLLGLLLGGLTLIVTRDYRWQRVLTFLNRTEDVQKRDYHAWNIEIAIGSGGLQGRGLGESRQKRLFLPEPHTDSIFAVTVEELGSLRSTVLLIAYLFLVTRIFRVARYADSPFEQYIALGIGTWFGMQVFLNVASMLHLIPLTGVPLPFMSAGGNALIISLAMIGIVLRIARGERMVRRPTR